MHTGMAMSSNIFVPSAHSVGESASQVPGQTCHPRELVKPATRVTHSWYRSIAHVQNVQYTVGSWGARTGGHGVTRVDSDHAECRVFEEKIS